MKQRKKTKFSIPARYLLLGLCGLCIIIMFLTHSTGTTAGPLNSVASYIFVPMQKGINSVGRYLSDKMDLLQSKQDLLSENEKLKRNTELLAKLEKELASF